MTGLWALRGLVSRLPAGTVCLYGADDRGVAIRRAIGRWRRDMTVACYLDTFRDGDFDGLPLRTPQALLREHRPFDYVLITSGLWEEIEWVLQEAGIDAYHACSDFPSPVRTRFRPVWVRYLIWKRALADAVARLGSPPRPRRTGRVFDAFTFFNELDLLELRLHTLDPVVDRFILVEADKTHTGQDKPLYFEANKARFARFLPKITHVVVDDFPRYNGNNSWRLEKFQREAVLRGLADSRPDDVLLVSDLDEIPRPEAVRRYKDTEGIKLFCQSWYRFYLNLQNASFPVWRYGSRMGTMADLAACRRPGLRATWPPFTVNRFYRYAPRYAVPDGGWHFSFLGGIDQIMEKIGALARPDNGLPKEQTREVIARRLARGQDISGNGYRLRRVALDDSFPRYLRDNRQRFNHLLLD